MNEAKLTEYLRRAQEEIIETGELDAAELNYKISLGTHMGKARETVLEGRDDWLASVKRALYRKENNISFYLNTLAFVEWCQTYPDIALQALKGLWKDGNMSPEERVRVFLAEVPKEKNFKTVATRLTPVSVLLMALGRDYPPFRRTIFRSAYDYLGHPRPHADADEGMVYGHAVTFLDMIVERARALGFERPRDRLEAQSVVWQMHGRKERPVKPVVEAPATLDDLAKKLLLEPRSYLSKTVWPLIDDKKQVIFQGPPGTGKTYVARELARHLAGSDKRVRLVQFHPSYAYEDFVQGFRPVSRDGQVGFELRSGPLLQVAEQARAEPNEKQFLVIDEINRGNLAKVFGELYYLLEYRDDEMQLQYSDELFAMPDNLYIIGTMNTADRSIALVDLALRRRFHFVKFHPDVPPIKGLLKRWLERDELGLEWLPGVVEDVNRMLPEQRDAAIGPSYFMKDDIDDQLDLIWEHNVLPYVEEQLYGNPGTLNEIKALWPGANADSEAPPDGDAGD